MSSRLTRKLVKALDPKYVLNQDTREREIEEKINDEGRKRFLKKSSESIPEGEKSLVDTIEDTTPTPEIGDYKKVRNIRERFRKGLSNFGKTTRRHLGTAREAMGRGARATRKHLGLRNSGKFPITRDLHVNPKYKRKTHISKIGTPENIGYTGESTSTVYQTNKFSGENPMILNNEVNLE